MNITLKTNIGKGIANSPLIKKALQNNAEMRAGVFEGAKYEDGTPVAQVLVWNEEGTLTEDGREHIPPRPVMRQTAEEGKKRWRPVLRKALKQNNMDIPKSLEVVGIVAQGDIMHNIDKFSTPVNAPATIEKKGRDNPLVDTGFLMQSVTYEVKKI